MNDRNQMIEANLKYARAAATKFSLGAPAGSAQWQDAFSAACEALVKAAMTWRPDGGANLGTWAWPQMKKAVLRLRFSERRRYQIERHADSDDVLLEDAFRAALGDSPEDLLIAAEDVVEKASRLERLPKGHRARVEDVLDGKGLSQYVRCNALRIAQEAGVRVPLGLVPEKKAMSSSQRWQRYWSRLSPEKKAVKNAKRNARRSRQGAERRAA